MSRLKLVTLAACVLFCSVGARANPFLEITAQVRQEIEIRTKIPSKFPQSFIDWFEKHFSAGTKDPASVFPEWHYNFALNLEQRVVLHCNLALMRREALLPFVGTIFAVDFKGAIRFEESQADFLFKVLEAVDYSGHFKASRGGIRGLRSPTIGLGMHFLELLPQKDIEAHFDYENPGKFTEAPWSILTRGLRHIRVDLNSWHDRSPASTLNAFRKQNSKETCDLAPSDLTEIGLFRNE